MIVDAKVIPRLDFQTLQPFSEAGVSAINVPASLWHGYMETCENLDELAALIESSDGAFARVLSAADIPTCQTSRTLGIISSISSSTAFDNELNNISELHAQGVRIAQPVFMAKSPAGSSFTDETDTGLTPIGRRFIAEFNRWGIAIDLSHVGDKTAASIIECSSSPVFFSQASPRSLNPARRNKSDEAIRAVANSGGVIGLASLRQYLPRADRSTVDDIADTIVHCINVAGREHVAIGSDLTPGQDADFYRYVSSRHGSGTPVTHSSADDNTPGFSDTTGYSTLRTTLRSKAVAESTIDRIMGTNLFRYFNDVWTPTEGEKTNVCS